MFPYSPPSVLLLHSTFFSPPFHLPYHHLLLLLRSSSYSPSTSLLHRSISPCSLLYSFHLYSSLLHPATSLRFRPPFHSPPTSCKLRALFPNEILPHFHVSSLTRALHPHPAPVSSALSFLINPQAASTSCFCFHTTLFSYHPPACIHSLPFLFPQLISQGDTGQIRFRTAALVRAPTILPFGLYLIQYVLQAGFGLGPFTATCVAAVPLVAAVGGMLAMLHKWEVAERTTFLSHHPAATS